VQRILNSEQEPCKKQAPMPDHAVDEERIKSFGEDDVHP